MLAAAAAVVGLVVVGTTVIAVYIRNKENRRTSSAKARSVESNIEPASDSSSADKDRSVVMDEIMVRSPRFIVDRVLCSGVCGGSKNFLCPRPWYNHYWVLVRMRSSWTFWPLATSCNAIIVLYIGYLSNSGGTIVAPANPTAYHRMVNGVV